MISRVAGLVLLNRSHDAAHELNEEAEIGENASDHRDSEIGVIEAFPKHAGLHDCIEFVVLKLEEDPIIGLPFARVNVIRTQSAGTEGFSDLNAVVIVDGGRDYLEAWFTIQQPRDAERLRKNPLGVFVNAINWSKEMSQ